jgi:hypothetical protein
MCCCSVAHVPGLHRPRLAGVRKSWGNMEAVAASRGVDPGRARQLTSKGMARCGDLEPRLSEEELVMRAAEVAAGTRHSADVGCHGPSPIISELRYLQYSTAFLVPIAHAALLGVVKGFWRLLLAAQPAGDPPQHAPLMLHNWPSVARAALKARRIIATDDFSRPYTGVHASALSAGSPIGTAAVCPLIHTACRCPHCRHSVQEWQLGDGRLAALDGDLVSHHAAARRRPGDCTLARAANVAPSAQGRAIHHAQ